LIVGIGLRYLGWLVEPETCGRLPPGIFLCAGTVPCLAAPLAFFGAGAAARKWLADRVSMRKTETRHPHH
jgi:hypothetical protein